LSVCWYEIGASSSSQFDFGASHISRNALASGF
jgi:hypothetical protein